MAFTSGLNNDPVAIAGGETYGGASIVLGTSSFEDGLVAGRFARMDTGVLSNFDGNTPAVAGVVLRNPANAIEDGGTFDADVENHVNYQRFGLVSVDVKAAETPAQFGQVYADIATGLATATNTDVEIPGSEFIEEIKTGVWLVKLNIGV